MSNRVAEHRARMKERGYKEVRYWVPDTASPQFVRRIHKECRALNESDHRDHLEEFLADVQTDVLDIIE